MSRIEYDLTIEDLAAFGEYCARTAPELRRAVYTGAIGGAAGILLVCGLGWERSEPPWVLVAGAVAALAWLWYWPRHVVSHARKLMRKQQRPCIGGLHVLEATPEALFAKCDVTESTTRWAGISGAVETPDHVFVMLTSTQGCVIPKARVRAGDLDQFVRQVREFKAQA